MSNLTLLYDVVTKMLAPLALVVTVFGSTWAVLRALQGKPEFTTFHRTPTYVCYPPTNKHVKVKDVPYDWSNYGKQ